MCLILMNFRKFKFKINNANEGRERENYKKKVQKVYFLPCLRQIYNKTFSNFIGKLIRLHKLTYENELLNNFMIIKEFQS